MNQTFRSSRANPAWVIGEGMSASVDHESAAFAPVRDGAGVSFGAMVGIFFDANGEGKAGAFAGLAFDLDQLPLMVARYRELWDHHGHAHEPRITLLAHVHVAESSQEARDHLRRYQFDFQRWVFGKRFGVPADQVELPPRITELESEECVIASGSPQQVIDKVAQLVELSGCDRFVYQGDYGGQPWDRVMSSLELYARDVLPVVAKL